MVEFTDDVKLIVYRIALRLFKEYGRQPTRIKGLSITVTFPLGLCCHIEKALRIYAEAHRLNVCKFVAAYDPYLGGIETSPYYADLRALAPHRRKTGSGQWFSHTKWGYNARLRLLEKMVNYLETKVNA